MQIRQGKPHGSGQLARTGVELSREARIRLHWMDFYHRFGNVARTCRHFRSESFAFAVAVSPLGQGQAGGAAGPGTTAGLDLHGGSYSYPSQTPRPAGGTA